ncbi:CENP-A-nucleosome distal centromere subunit CENP-L [Penicillium argentinense]|uniref:CENP-A-nucleosome distal centromere subunit CENP-L n=1 Tax=Penicillium argentinense TaxID=1131581 RepID=A0A9W9KF70_9EURO|nr:CENP-A-nucleosome distal centromere subunit CENP-L [Penicillium argentinense]KAJ5103576.1 CENP-A-nucleosome distal centromere subunit CENP-L [Penicillium argentinense]
MEQVSHRQLFNTSWTIHRLSPLHHGKDCETLLDNQAALKVYAARLRDQLTGDILAGLHSSATTAEDDALSKTGALRRCHWLPISTESSAGRATFPGILVTLEYENIIYKAALLADPNNTSGLNEREGSTFLPLLLTRFPNALRQTFISFLSANFDTYCSTLRLPSNFLCTGMETFIDELRGFASQSTANAIIEDTIKELQLTLAFSPPIAPALRSLNIGISRNSLIDFLRDGVGKSKGKQKARSPLISNLTAYLEKHLAMKLDSDGSAGNEVAKHVRLSKVACAAFVLGGEGRMKLVVAEQPEDDEEILPAQRASETLLLAAIRKAVIGDQAAT